MKPEQRTARRLLDEQIHDRVESLLAQGTERSRVWVRVAGLMEINREDVVAAYWRHRKRQGW
jgi:hypothetical protein